MVYSPALYRTTSCHDQSSQIGTLKELLGVMIEDIIQCNTHILQIISLHNLVAILIVIDYVFDLLLLLWGPLTSFLNVTYHSMW